MKKISLIMMAIILSGVALATGTQVTPQNARHVVTLAGLEPGEGRYIRSDIFENNTFKSGYYFCAGEGSSIYSMEYFLSQSKEPFHAAHLIRFSVCQDETMANCQEFAVDKYNTVRNLEGYLQNDTESATVDISPVKSAYQSCQPDSGMDELVKTAIHLDDRRFAHIG